MENLLKKIEELREQFLKYRENLGIERQAAREAELRVLMAEPGFWDDQSRAISIGQEAEGLRAAVAGWEDLGRDLRESEEIIALANAEGDSSLAAEMENKFLSLEDKFKRLQFQSLFSGEYDNSNALVSIHAGTGGVDAQDWAEMILRMLARFAERKGFKAAILDTVYGNEAGLKSAALQISGPYAYAYLKSENGVHRLLRNSPFNADGLRQTSFALVEVGPELKDEGGVEIKDEDLRIDVYRSSGPGGQSVNTTDSAVRIVHLSTGITVACQSERSQKQNKENAMRLLRSKLQSLALEAKQAKDRELKGDLQKAEWGRQIRSYFLYGNRLVKDHRTDYETSDVDSVLDGDLESFMEAYLRWLKKSA